MRFIFETFEAGAPSVGAPSLSSCRPQFDLPQDRYEGLICSCHQSVSQFAATNSPEGSGATGYCDTVIQFAYCSMLKYIHYIVTTMKPSNAHYTTSLIHVTPIPAYPNILSAPQR